MLERAARHFDGIGQPAAARVLRRAAVKYGEVPEDVRSAELPEFSPETSRRLVEDGFITQVLLPRSVADLRRKGLNVLTDGMSQPDKDDFDLQESRGGEVAIHVDPNMTMLRRSGRGLSRQEQLAMLEEANRGFSERYPGTQLVLAPAVDYINYIYTRLRTAESAVQNFFDGRYTTTATIIGSSALYVSGRPVEFGGVDVFRWPIGYPGLPGLGVTPMVVPKPQS